MYSWIKPEKESIIFLLKYVVYVRRNMFRSTEKTNCAEAL